MPQSTANSTVPNCIVCGTKASRVNSVYCSDDCIRKHANTTKVTTVVSTSHSSSGANDSITMVTSPTSSSPFKSPSDGEKKANHPKMVHPVLFKDKMNHVVVFDKSTGKYITGKNAPTTDKLQQWLSDHPNHEILKPGTPQAAAFKAKQQQLKSLQKDMQVEKELFAVTQPAKIQTKLRFESDKMVYVNPTTQKQATTTVALKRPISATSSTSPVSVKSPVFKGEPITKTPKLTSSPAASILKTPTSQKRRTATTVNSFMHIFPQHFLLSKINVSIQILI